MGVGLGQMLWDPRLVLVIFQLQPENMLSTVPALSTQAHPIWKLQEAADSCPGHPSASGGPSQETPSASRASATNDSVLEWGA